MITLDCCRDRICVGSVPVRIGRCWMMKNLIKMSFKWFKWKASNGITFALLFDSRQTSLCWSLSIQKPGHCLPDVHGHGTPTQDILHQVRFLTQLSQPICSLAILLWRFASVSRRARVDCVNHGFDLVHRLWHWRRREDSCGS